MLYLRNGDEFIQVSRIFSGHSLFGKLIRLGVCEECISEITLDNIERLTDTTLTEIELEEERFKTLLEKKVNLSHAPVSSAQQHFELCDLCDNEIEGMLEQITMLHEALGTVMAIEDVSVQSEMKLYAGIEAYSPTVNDIKDKE